LLALAGEQGLLYATQIATLKNDSTSISGRDVLTQLLAGQLGGLEAIPIVPVAVEDAALDATQRDAIARALTTPDVCLIVGLPGTGKSRVIAEIITQAANRGERVLLVAPSGAALDRVLGQVHDRPALWPLRCVAREEAPTELPPPIRALTFPERVSFLANEAAARARAAVKAADTACARHRQEERVWSHLRELAQSHERLEQQLLQLRQKRERLVEEIDREATALEGAAAAEHESTFHGALRRALRVRDEALAKLGADHAKLASETGVREAERKGYQEQLDVLRPLAEAREQKRWWTRAWWQARRHGDVVATVAAVQGQLQQTDKQLEKLASDEAKLQLEQDTLRSRFATERERLAGAEVAARRAELNDQEAADQRELNLIEEKSQNACLKLDPLASGPGELSPAAVEARYEAWRKLVAEDEEAKTFAQHWVRCLEESRDSLPRRVLECANVVAATAATLNGDELFREGSFPGRPFDLLVVDEAEQMTESEFAGAARRTRRWVLVGEPAGEGAEAAAHSAPGPAARPNRPGAPPRRKPPSRPIRPGFFHHLWHLLHCDPRRLPYAWVQEEGRLRCRLHPVDAEQFRWIESERVADFPEIELRILAAPHVPPQLVEVVFPPAMNIAQAKEFIYRELQQLPVQAPGNVSRWVEESDRLVFRLADPPLTSTVPVHLEPGVCERVGRLATGGQPRAEGAASSVEANSAPWYTCCVEFDRTAGWQRERAAQWVEEHLSLRDLGRTARLEKVYRMTPALAAVVAGLLGLGDSASDHYLPRAAAEGQARPNAHARPGLPPVEFVPVPPLWHPRPEKATKADRRGGRVAATEIVPPAPVLPKVGAGLELDLSDVRHRDRLPGELRPVLPDHGFVNYLEAQEVVHVLEELVGDPRTRSSAAGSLAIGVVTLYAAQAQLIRHLASRVPALAASGLEIQIDTPAAFRQRECDVVLVSLTRSHSHRAVTFGETAKQLAVALTRSRTRLIVFGDPGTLSKRRHWEGLVDHLDEAASARERAICGRLLDYLQRLGPRPHGFRLGEGCHA
jgi:hypothetical protein